MPRRARLSALSCLVLGPLMFLGAPAPAASAQEKLPMAIPQGAPAAEGRGVEPGAEGDLAAAIDAELVTGAVMTEKDMLQYCVNISDQAREIRYSIIEKQLDEKKAQIEDRLTQLSEKMQVIKEYVEIREKFRAAAEQQVVAIFETMRPDAAAKQLSELNTEMSAAIIMKLDAKISSRIMTEMAPKQAALIANYLTVAMQPPEGKPVTQ